MIDTTLQISNATTTPAAISIGMGDLVQAADRDQKTLEQRIKKDKTKTQPARDLFAFEHAEKRLKQIWKMSLTKQDEIKGELYKLNKRIEGQMKVAGTTDMLMLTSYGQILQGLKVSEITELGRSGDVDALRACLLIPALSLKENFRNAKDMFTDELERVTLGDDHKTYESLKQQLADADKLEVGLLQTASDYAKKAKQIKQNIVTDDEVQPVVG